MTDRENQGSPETPERKPDVRDPEKAGVGRRPSTPKPNPEPRPKPGQTTQPPEGGEPHRGS